MRLIFVALAALMGFYGIAIGIFIYALILGNQKSFGAPFLSPIPKIKNKSMFNAVFVNPMWSREKRPDFLKTKNDREEPKISRSWKIRRKD